MPVPPAIARHQFSSVSPSRRSYGPSKLNIPSSLAPSVVSAVELSMVVGAILYDPEQVPFVYCVSGKPSSGCSNASAVILASVGSGTGTKDKQNPPRLIPIITGAA
jgi:hypothetical protein